jgi:hypothetical protein
MSIIMLKHYLYQSQSIYIKQYLMGVGDRLDFLSIQPNVTWSDNLRKFDGYENEIEGRTKMAGIPLVATFIPNRAQAAMISMGTWPQGYDPYILNAELRTIVESHGGIYIDILPGFRKIPNPEQYYYPVDGHPDARGHAIIADLLAKELTSGAVPALKELSMQRTELK